VDEHPNITLMKKVYEAFGVGDVETAGKYWTPDAVHHYPGRGEMSGTHKGLAESTAFAQKMFDMTGGRIGMEVLDIGASDQYAFALVRTRYERNNTVLEMPFVNVMRIENGLIAEFWTYPNDQYAVDEFWV
jgi:ketosteroid isomerase-like protein